LNIKRPFVSNRAALSTTAMNNSTDMIILLSFILTVLYYHETRFNLKPTARNPNQGRKTVSEWLERPVLLRIGTGLHLHTFQELCAWIRAHTRLDDTRYMSLKEKLTIFLHICHTGEGFENIKIVFNRSKETISRYVTL
jgi:hypothetical protein